MMSLMKKLKIGTRGSALALWQANFVGDLISGQVPDINIEIIRIKTTGDRILDRNLPEIGGKGVFVKEIEDSLIKKEIDIAVHSLKDLPVILPDGLILCAFIKRHNPCDVLVSRGEMKLSDHKKGDLIGTGSLRRKAQILSIYPDLEIVPVRGNVGTRIKKLETHGLASVVLAGAGVERLGLNDRISEVFDTDTIIPAPGQGIIAIECREEDAETSELLESVDDSGSRSSAILERSFLGALGGDCSVPVGCYSELDGHNLSAVGIIIAPDGRTLVRDRIKGPVKDSSELGSGLSMSLLEAGGRKILSEIHKQ